MLTTQSWPVNQHLIEACLELCQSNTKKLVLNEPTGDFFYDQWKIKPDLSTTVWNSLLNTIPDKIGEARIITLEPGETYMAHSDIDDRYHLNLQSQQAYLIDLDNHEMHLLETDCYWYLMDAGRTHVASNFGSIDRIQLVVRKLLQKSKSSTLQNISISPKKLIHDYRYRFDKNISPFLNYANKNGLLDNFKVSGDEVSFSLCGTVLEKFNSLLTEDFKVSYA